MLLGKVCPESRSGGAHSNLPINPSLSCKYRGSSPRLGAGVDCKNYAGSLEMAWQAGALPSEAVLASLIPRVLCPGCLLASSLLRAPVLPPPWRRQAPTRLSQSCFAASGAPRGRMPSAPGLTELCTRIQQEYFEVGVIVRRAAPARLCTLHCSQGHTTTTRLQVVNHKGPRGGCPLSCLLHMS